MDLMKNDEAIRCEIEDRCDALCILQDIVFTITCADAEVERIERGWAYASSSSEKGMPNSASQIGGFEIGKTVTTLKSRPVNNLQLRPPHFRL